ncbi:hypothetical protein ACLB2K_049589 [Fragaria x ananassa]
MKHVHFWTRVFGIPTLYEEPDNLRLIGNLLGGYIDYDNKEFLWGKMRILFTHDISKPLLPERCVFLSQSIEPSLKFQYERLQGRCSICNLITHACVWCEERSAISPVIRSLNFANSAPPPVVDKRPILQGSSSSSAVNIGIDGVVDPSPDVLVAVSAKRKAGRPLGQKNKVPRPSKTLAAPPLRVTTSKFDKGKVGPNDKGKEIV